MSRALLVVPIVVISAMAAEQPMTRDGKTGRGKGIMVNVSNGRGVIPGSFEQVKDNPYVAGVQVNLSWARLEPDKGKFRWDEIDRLLDQYGKAGKQVAFKFTAVAGKVPTDGQTAKGKGNSAADAEHSNDETPRWLFDDPQVKRLGGIASPKGKLPLYPVFWDPAYQKHVGEFLAAFAKKYDGDPRIEYIRMGGWQIGTNEPSFYGGAAIYLKAQLAEHGEKITDGSRSHLSADSRYAEAVVALIDLWHANFKKTRLAATIHFPKFEGGKTFEDVMNARCAKHHCTILNTGLNERDKTATRSTYREWHDKHECKVGWGGLTHLGWSDDKRPENQKAGMLMDAFRQGIGSDDDKKLSPASRVSYLVLGLDNLKEIEALKWASGRLVE